jgi:hypothetical protein
MAVSSNGYLDMTRMLDFAAAQGIRFDAISWHENNTSVFDREVARPPRSIPSHVAAVRGLLSARPSLGTPAIFINEFSAQWAHLIPGWRAGYLAALEEAGVEQANLSCWQEAATGPASQCFAPGGPLDGLLADDGSTPRAVFWVSAAYAALTGERVASSVEDQSFSGLAVRAPGGAIDVLLGRHVSCMEAINALCATSFGARPQGLRPPSEVALMVRVPSGRGPWQVTLQQIPVTSPLSAPFTNGPVTRGSFAADDQGSGILKLWITGVADGDAWIAHIQPA